MSRILVTGGSGFIGSNVVRHFASQGDEVTNIDIARPRDPHAPGRWEPVDILDRAALRRVMREFEPDTLFHLAARTDLDGRSVSDYPANTTGVANVLAAATDAPRLNRLVMASSMLVCRLGYRPSTDTDFAPSTPYGESKVVGEKLVRAAAASLPWTIVRPTSLWGPFFGAPYRSFFEMVQRGTYVHPRGIAVKRSYGFVLNAVHQLARIAGAARNDVEQRVFYIADYEPIEILQWANLIARTSEAPPVRQMPLSMFRLAAHIGDLARNLGIRMPLTSFRLGNLLTEAVYDTTATRTVCGSLPYDVEAGVQITVDWLGASRRPPKGLDDHRR